MQGTFSLLVLHVLFLHLIVLLVALRIVLSVIRVRLVCILMFAVRNIMITDIVFVRTADIVTL